MSLEIYDYVLIHRNNRPYLMLGKVLHVPQESGDSWHFEIDTDYGATVIIFNPLSPNLDRIEKIPEEYYRNFYNKS